MLCHQRNGAIDRHHRHQRNGAIDRRGDVARQATESVTMDDSQTSITCDSTVEEDEEEIRRLYDHTRYLVRSIQVDTSSN